MLTKQMLLSNVLSIVERLHIASKKDLVYKYKKQITSPPSPNHLVEKTTYDINAAHICLQEQCKMHNKKKPFGTYFVLLKKYEVKACSLGRILNHFQQKA